LYWPANWDEDALREEALAGIAQEHEEALEVLP
jgi:hypothetical protein